MADQTPAMPLPFDSSDVQPYMDMQRKQMLAQMLMGAFQNSANAPDPQGARVGPYAVQARRGIFQDLAPVLAGALAGRAQKGAFNAQAAYLSPQAGAALSPSTGAGDGIAAPGTDADTTVAPRTPQAVAAARNPNVPPGMNPADARNLYMRMGSHDYAKDVLAKALMPSDQELTAIRSGMNPRAAAALITSKANDPDVVQLAKAANVDPQAAAGDALKKALHMPLELVKADETGYDANHNPVVTAPKGAIQTTWNNGQPTQSLIPGGAAAQAAETRAVTAAKESQTPHFTDDPFHPGQPNVTYTSPPALGSGSTGAGPGIKAPPGNAADLEAQRKGAEEGVKYAAKLQDDAATALQGQRHLSEMGNLLTGFNPGAGAPVLQKIGSVAQALGVPSDTVEKYTHMNTGNVEAFQKGTAALAGEAAKQMTNKVTQQDFQIFLANNPNWMMTAEGIKRAMDFMGRGFDEPLAKQAAFRDYSMTAPANRWNIDFEAGWNKQEAAKIKAGDYNSVPGSMTGLQTRADVEKQGGIGKPSYAEGQFAHSPPDAAGNVSWLVRKNGKWVPSDTGPSVAKQ